MMMMMSTDRSKAPSCRRIAILTTGGTIGKTYDEALGKLGNYEDTLEAMLAALVLTGVVVDRIPVMSKDSLEMTPSDHEHIAKVASVYAASHDGVIIVHGTDRLTATGDCLYETLGPDFSVPIILTGAMRPFILRTTDSSQNLCESLLAIQLVPPGVYCVMHNSVLAFPGVRKDYENMTFVKEDVDQPAQPKGE